MSSPEACFEPHPVEGYEWALPLVHSDNDRLADLEGQPQGGSWKPIRFGLLKEDESRRMLARADFPWYGSQALVLRPDAISVLKPVVRDDAEMLPLESAEGPLALLSPTRVLDALDEEYSEIIRFSTGNVMTIERYELRPEAIRDAAVFKLSAFRRGPRLVTERFVEAVEGAGLSGLEFRKIWPVNGPPPA